MKLDHLAVYVKKKKLISVDARAQKELISHGYCRILCNISLFMSFFFERHNVKMERKYSTWQIFIPKKIT